MNWRSVGWAAESGNGKEIAVSTRGQFGKLLFIKAVVLGIYDLLRALRRGVILRRGLLALC